MSKKNDVVEEQVTNETLVDETTKLKQEVEMIMAAAREEARKIIEAAQEVANDMIIPAPTQKNNPYYEELVPVMLFKDSDKYKDDVFVAINGESCLIQRGKTVHIKRKFAILLEQSQNQDIATADMIAGFTQEYKEKESKLN